MSAHTRKPGKATVSVSESYGPLLAELKLRVRSAQVKAALAVNAQRVQLYGHMGRRIARQQAKEGWGTGVIPRLSARLHAELPEVKGFSERKIKRMLTFAREYPAPYPIVPQAAAQLPKDGVAPVVPQAAAQSVEHGWSRAVLTVQIEACAHIRAGRAVTNFAETLPPVQSDLAQEVLKDPHTFDFLTLSPEARERELEEGLTEHLQKFLVESGVGFAFVGRRVHLKVAGEDHCVDLLFYHLKPRCLVVLDLKMEAFKPEFAGTMNFYLAAVDEQRRHAHDQPTIGPLLCREKNRLTVEYALRDIKKPIGVAEWKARLAESLPKQLRGSPPSLEDLEAGLAGGKSTKPSGPQ